MRRSLISAAAGLALALSASPALAATTTLPADVTALPRGGAVEYGTIELTLSGAAKGRLAKAGTKVSAAGTGKVKGSRISFDPLGPGSVLDVTTMQGTVPADGTLTFKGKKGTAKLTDLTFQPGVERNITAKLGKKLLLLGTLKGGKATFAKQSDGKLSGAKVALSSKAVKAINAKTGGGLATGAFGSLLIDVTGRELPIKDGVATLTIDPAFMKLLADNGFTLTATPPATITGNVASIQLTGGAFDPEGLTGRLAMEGKVTIGKPGLSLDLFGWRAIVNKTQKDLYANVNDGVAGVVANVDVSGLTATIKAPEFVATGGKLFLAKIATDILKQQFGIVAPVGTPLGTVDLTGHLNGA